MVFALAALMQTVISFGIPRLIPKLLSEVGLSLTHSRSRRIVVFLLVIRLGGTSALMFAAYMLGEWLDWGQPVSSNLLIVGAAFILVGLVQFDADSIIQVLGLQRVSSFCLVFEATTRLAAVSALAWHGQLHSAAAVFAVWSITSGIAAVILLAAIAHALLRPDQPVTGTAPTRREILLIGLAGYSSSLAWFASSPAVLRLVASQTLVPLLFAGYAFMQGLVLSFQRYTPGSLMLPFLEPAVMRDYARTRTHHRLEAALSLMTKVDMIFVGAAIVGTVVSGRALIDLMSDGKYGDAAYALPALMTYIVTTSIYRSFEIAAIAIGASAALLRTFAISAFWLAVAIVLAPRLGLAALLICPIADALTRLTIVYLAIRRADLNHFFDLHANALILAAAAGCAIIGGMIVAQLPATPLMAILTGTGAALAFLAATLLIQPLKESETELLLNGHGGRMLPLLQLITSH